eukprot:s492_g2.t1
MEVCFLASGERVALLDAADFEGKPAKAVKQTLASKIGVTRFRQKLFLEGDAVQISDDYIFPSVPPKVQLVVLEFCPPDVAEDNKMTSAAKDNDVIALEQLLKCPRNPKTRDKWGTTPLEQAACKGHVEPMRLLLEAGVEIDAPFRFPPYSPGPLFQAVSGGHLEAVRFLVEKGAQKDLANFAGQRPMDIAVCLGHVHIARFLVEEGARKDELVSGKWGALTGAAQNGLLDMVCFLVEVGTDKDWTDEFGDTALHKAAAAGDLDIVRFLIESGGNRHVVNNAGKIALDLASERRDEEVVRFLSEIEEEEEEEQEHELPRRKVQRLNSPYRR